MGTRTATWDVANNASKTIEERKDYTAWETLNVTMKVNLNSVSGGSTEFKIDFLSFYNTNWFYEAHLKDLYVTGGEGDDWFYVDELGDESNSSSTDWKSYVYMNGGNDTVYIKENTNNRGTDYISLGDGDDYAYAGSDNDTVYGGNGIDVILGCSGDDKLYGEAGDDVIDAGTGNDQAYGGNGNDQLSATLSTGKTPTLTGGDGYDIFTLCSDLYVSTASASSDVDWGSVAAGSVAQYGSANIATSVWNAASGATAWNPITATVTAFGGAMLGKLVSSLAAGGSTVTTTNMSSGTYIEISDFDPREDTLQLTFDKDIALEVESTGGGTGANLLVNDMTGATRVKAVLDSDFYNLFGGDVNDIKSMMNVYLQTGLTVSSSSVASNGTDITSSLSGYTDASGNALTISDFGVTSGKMYVMGSFAGQTIDGGYYASTPTLVGTAAADIISAERIDFAKTDSNNTIESMAQVKTTNQHALYGAAGSDVLIGATAKDILDGGDGVDHLYGLGGADTLTGGLGNDYFHVLTSCLSTDQSSSTASSANAASDTITDFSSLSWLGESDIIYVDNTAVKASDVKFAQSGSDILVSFTSQSNTVTLQNKTLTEWSFSTSTDSTGHVMITGTYTGEVSGGCFITTATAEQFGWADDCRTLTVLRWFRDNVMAKRPDWEADIATYYKIAPGIVTATRHDSALYQELWEKFLRKAVAAVVAGKHQRAYDIYRGMVATLATRYLQPVRRVHRVA